MTSSFREALSEEQAKLSYDELLTALVEVEMVSHLLVGRRVKSLPDD